MNEYLNTFKLLKFKLKSLKFKLFKNKIGSTFYSAAIIAHHYLNFHSHYRHFMATKSLKIETMRID